MSSSQTLYPIVLFSLDQELRHFAENKMWDKVYVMSLQLSRYSFIDWKVPYTIASPPPQQIYLGYSILAIY